MPIYAYRCAACGAEQDVLQKISDAPLTVCPVCGAESFHKVLTAPAFQLKGSGWYVTDFRDGHKKQAGSGHGGGASKSEEGSSAAKADGAKADGANADGARTDRAKSDGAKADAPAKRADSSSAPSGSTPAGPGAD